MVSDRSDVLQLKHPIVDLVASCDVAGVPQNPAGKVFFWVFIRTLDDTIGV
jgi:hypothetical protein